MIFFPVLFQLDEPIAVTITTVVITTERSGLFLHQHTYQHVHGMNVENLQGKKKVTLSPLPQLYLSLSVAMVDDIGPGLSA